MDKNTIELLEFNKILSVIAGFCISEAGKKCALELRPETDKEKIQINLNILAEALLYKNEIIKLELDFPPLDGVFDYLKRKKILDEDGLFGVKVFLEKTKSLKEFIDSIAFDKTKNLLERFKHFPWPQQSYQALQRCLDKNGDIKDNASPTLSSIREHIRSIQKRCRKKIIEYIDKYNLTGMLQDEYLTISSDRYVIALKSNFKGKVEGIVHDYSQSGETCYFEPIFLIELNNRLQELKKEEREEINNILKYLTNLIAYDLEKIKILYSLMIEMDLIRAKVLFASEMNGSILSIEDKLHIKGVVHPLLYLQKKDKVEPIDLILLEGQKGLILTGGNSGGKTVSLKTLGLCALMTYAGLPVPCKEHSTIPFFKNIFVFLGDEQSIEQRLSTFTAQIIKLKNIWPKIDDSTLVLLDEFGTGTDPSQGAALAQAVIESLIEKGSFVFAVTHFPSLKVFALSHRQLRAAMVLFDPITKRPLYKIAYDQVGTSQALDVARKFGMPKEILSKAEKYLLINDKQTTKIIEKLNEITVKREKELEKLKNKIKELDEEKKKLKEKYHTKIQKLIEDISNALRDIVISYKEGKIHRKLAQQKLKQLREKLKNEIDEKREKREVDINQLKVGDEILYIPWNKFGSIEAIDTKKKKLKVNINGVSLWVDPFDISCSGQKENKDSSFVYHIKQTSQNIPLGRLDLRGYRVDEAETELIKFLDQAIYRGISSVEIVHGRGEGILRNFVQDFLKKYPYVKSFSFAPKDRGGDGVTIVEID